MQRFFIRLIRALQVDPHIYQEITKDRSSLIQAATVATFSSIAAGIGSVAGYPEKIPFAILLALVGWITSTVLIYILGRIFFPAPETKTDFSAVFRVIGFASAPGFLRLLAFFPAFSAIVIFGAAVWTLGAMVIATQQVFHYHNLPRTLAINLSGWIFYQWILLQT